MTKILVTGGAGFIGSSIVNAYISAGHSVAVIDNLSTGERNRVHPRARFYKADVCDYGALEKIMRIEQPEIINHQAALVSVPDSLRNPGQTYLVNTQGTLNTLVAGSGAKRFILASSGGALYADPKSMPVPETEAPSAVSPYGFSKQYAEEIVRAMAPLLGMTYVILRPSNVYGSGQRGALIALCAELARANKPITIFGRSHTRDYVHVSDVARANLLALSKGTNQTLHISTGVETTNEAVQRLAAKFFLWTAEPRFTGSRPGDVVHSSLSPALAGRILGWRPTVTIEQGIALLAHDQTS
jgi:UDP-glucose 4-epimerase